jgi:hypothetical protein
MKQLNYSKTFVALALVLLTIFTPLEPLQAQQSNPQPAFEGKYVATDYNYGGAGSNTPGALTIDSGGSGTGAQTYTLRVNAFITLPRLGGRKFMPLAVNAPILIDGDPVTPSAVSCSTPDQPGTCSITATVAAVHGAGSRITSGTFGLQEALNDSFQSGGGSVIVDPLWTASGGTNAILTAATPYSNVVIEDKRVGTQYWSATQTTATVLAAPTTLVAATAGFGVNGANFTGGAYTGSSTYIACIAYVDIMGNEGPCSATFTIATSGALTTDQIGFTAPAASTGAVGYTIYIDLAGGTYNLTYQVPLTSTVCTLTKLETVTPACAVANTTYSQTGSGAVVSALTVNTAPLHLLATTASTTSAYIGTPSGRTTYGYAPHTLNGAMFGLLPTQQPYAIAVAAGSTVPEVIGTIPIPIGLMNQVGRAIRVCGQATNAGANTATVENIELLWDAAGSNTAGAPVIVGQMQITVTQVGTAENYQFCETLQTTVSGASVTAGSLEPISGVLNLSEAAGTLHSSGPDVKAAAVGSLNLAGTGGNTQRIHVIWLHTTGTDGAGVTLQGLTVELI